MTGLDAERLIQILADFYPVKYQARTLNGAECVSVHTSEQLLPFFGEIIKECETLGEATALLQGARVDSLGMGVVIYWPRCKVGETSG